MIRGREDPNTTKNRGHYQPASKMPFKGHFAGGLLMAVMEYWLGSFVIIQGILKSMLNKSPGDSEKHAK